MTRPRISSDFGSGARKAGKIGIDINYLGTDECRLYPAIPPAPLNREVVGWSPKPRMTADTVTDAPTGSRCGGSENEQIAGERLATRAAMKAMAFHNRKRRHSTSGHESRERFVRDGPAARNRRKRAA
jgi:hypothetical protein